MTEERNIVVPGDKVSGSAMSNVYKFNNETYSAVYGLMTKKDDFVKIVPLKGIYMPEIGDYIVGIITDVKYGGYVIDLNSPYTAFLPSRREYNHGDILFAKVGNVDEVKSVSLIDEKQLFEGELIDVLPVKVPRVIGKKDSMINMIKEATSCLIFVGRNGRIWVKGDNYAKAVEAIKFVEENAHTSGLTEKVMELLKTEVSKN